MGELTKAESYLSERLEMLSDEKVIIITKINNLNIESDEITTKISQMENDVDDAFEIFSPRVKKNDFIRDEILKLNVKKKELSELIDKYEAQLLLVNQDINVIKDALGNVDDIDEEFDTEINNNTNIDNISRKFDKTGINILNQQELERQRIARDLHDTTVQVLTNLVHKCEICSKIVDVDTTRTKLELEIMSKTLRETIDDMRNIIYNLRPMSFDDLGIETTIRNAIQKLDSMTDMEITFSIQGEVVDIPSVISLTILRLIQEATNNSIKYSKGNHLDILLKFQTDSLHLEVVDDGQGFDLDNILEIDKDEDSHKGFGLSIMKERVFLLSGNITIESKINEGTKIIIDVPIQ